MSLLGACGQFTINADCECGYYTSNAGKMIHWDDGATVNFVVHKDVPNAHRQGLKAVKLKYDELLSNTHITIDTESNGAPSLKDGRPDSVSGDGVNGIYYLPEPWPFREEVNGRMQQSESDAMTVIRADGGGLQEADIFFRSSSFELSSAQATGRSYAPTEAMEWVASTAPENVRWLYRVGVHEMGHAMGLVHTHDDSIMQPKVSLDPIENPFTDRDRKVIGQVYALRPAE